MFKFVRISGILGDASFCDGKDVINIPFKAILHNKFAIYPDQQYAREELEKLLEKKITTWSCNL